MTGPPNFLEGVYGYLKDPHVKSDHETIAKALEGDYRQEHLFALRQAYELYLFYQQQIETCDHEIEAYLIQFDSRIDPDAYPLSPPKRGSRKQGNEPRFDLRTHLYRISGVDFTRIDGLQAMNVHTILAEVGLDPDRFPSSGHFTSWLGLCPNNCITGGKIKSSKTSKVVNRAATAFRLAAQAVSNSQSAIGGYYRRMRSRLGAPKAITATAHKLSRIFYHLWKNGGAYQDLGVDYYEKQYTQRIIRTMQRKARQLGFEMTLIPAVGVPVS